MWTSDKRRAAVAMLGDRIAHLRRLLRRCYGPFSWESAQLRSFDTPSDCFSHITDFSDIEETAQLGGMAVHTKALRRIMNGLIKSRRTYIRTTGSAVKPPDTIGLRLEPGFDQITKDHRVILLSLGGVSAFMGEGKFKNLSREFVRRHPEVGSSIVMGSGYAQPGTDSGKIAQNLVAFFRKMKELNPNPNFRPKIILAGKSMGGCKLWRTTRRLHRDHEDIKIDLFIGVDVSCLALPHFDIYQCWGIDEKQFEDNVLDLINFYQSTKGQAQNGHPLMWVRPRFCKHGYVKGRMCRDINVDVTREDSYWKDGILVHEALCPGVGHMKIGECPNLVDEIIELISKKI
jgi:hypothetical protein